MVAAARSHHRPPCVSLPFSVSPMLLYKVSHPMSLRTAARWRTMWPCRRTQNSCQLLARLARLLASATTTAIVASDPRCFTRMSRAMVGGSVGVLVQCSRVLSTGLFRLDETPCATVKRVRKAKPQNRLPVDGGGS